jgi:hypothetical protein
MSETTPVSNGTPQILLEHHLKSLRLPTFLREYDKVARQCAAEDVDYPRYLLRMTELELLERERRSTCVWQLILAHLRKLTLAHLWKLMGRCRVEEIRWDRAGA